MSLRYALLGLISKKPSTGYELHRLFKEQVVYFWHAHHTQIYRELAKLEAEKLVESEHVQQDAHPDKIIYTLTGRGTQALIHWMLEKPPQSASIKDDFLLRTAAFPVIPYEEAVGLLERTRERERHALELTMQWRDKRFGGKELPDGENIGEFLTSEFGVRYARSYMEWCEWAIAVLRRLAERE
ncbi:PadR family transcriptional regulator [Paenibacillus sp. MBLB4367]|uniref:PadR family transcriptional regulator n=1 Tax=Paenibacillus sp. MBLB4367 TaxID=3384767 RepID=UPI003907F50E